MNLEFIASLALILYALTFLFASSRAFQGIRESLGDLLDELFPERDYKMEECRMCVGVWLALLLFLACLPLDAVSWRDGVSFFAAYGLSYFMATQERP